MSDPKLEQYAFRIPILFEGDRGSGKTFDARDYADKHGYKCLEIAGNESTEAFDFLGHMVQSDKGMVWKDGKLSQAYRLASKGQKIVLIIDEILRIPQRHLSVLLSAMSPDSKDRLRLQTGRMTDIVDGVGVEEEIICPAENIAIFATTNVGPEFAIDELDPAVAERFIILRKDTETATLTKILQNKCDLRSFNKLIALRCVELFNKTQRMVKTGTLNRHATTRTLARAIEKARSESEVKDILKDQILLWVDRDSSGLPVESQKELLSKTIDELFADLPKPASGGTRIKPERGIAPKTPSPPKARASSPWDDEDSAAADGGEPYSSGEYPFEKKPAAGSKKTKTPHEILSGGKTPRETLEEFLEYIDSEGASFGISPEREKMEREIDARRMGIFEEKDEPGYGPRGPRRIDSALASLAEHLQGSSLGVFGSLRMGKSAAAAIMDEAGCHFEHNPARVSPDVIVLASGLDQEALDWAENFADENGAVVISEYEFEQICDYLSNPVPKPSKPAKRKF